MTDSAAFPWRSTEGEKDEGREKETDVAIDGWVSGLFNKAAL